jgi:hypothetical protein
MQGFERKELAEKVPFTAFSLGIFTILSIFGGRNYSQPPCESEQDAWRTQTLIDFSSIRFSEASEVAFELALKIALVAGAKLTMLHVDASRGAEWQDFPRRPRRSSQTSAMPTKFH